MNRRIHYIDVGKMSFKQAMITLYGKTEGTKRYHHHVVSNYAIIFVAVLYFLNVFVQQMY